MGQYWFCVSSRRYLCSSGRFRSSSRRMWDNIGFAFRLVATCVRLVATCVHLVASDRRVAECGTILVLRFVSSLLVFVSSLRIVDSPNVGQYQSETISLCKPSIYDNSHGICPCTAQKLHMQSKIASFCEQLRIYINIYISALFGRKESQIYSVVK